MVLAVATEMRMKRRRRKKQIPCPAGSLRKQEGREAVLTPANCAELEHISVNVDIVDTHKEKVEVEAFDGHPGEAAEQCKVQDGGQRRACCPRHGGHGQCRTQQEGGIQEQHGGMQVHVDVCYGVILLPVGESKALCGPGSSARQQHPLGS